MFESKFFHALLIFYVIGYLLLINFYHVPPPDYDSIVEATNTRINCTIIKYNRRGVPLEGDCVSFCSALVRVPIQVSYITTDVNTTEIIQSQNQTELETNFSFREGITPHEGSSTTCYIQKNIENVTRSKFISLQPNEKEFYSQQIHYFRFVLTSKLLRNVLIVHAVICISIPCLLTLYRFIYPHDPALYFRGNEVPKDGSNA